MRLHYLQHVPFENLGSIAGWAEKRRCKVHRTRLYAGDALPSSDDFDVLIVLGGPMGVHDEQQYPWLAGEKKFLERAIARKSAILGICLGAQLLADVLGARVYRSRHKEIGWLPIERVPAAESSAIGRTLPEQAEVFHWHGDTFELPAGAIQLARSAACEQQGFVFNEHVLAFQFHLETTRQSAELLIENCQDELTEGPYIQSAEHIRSSPNRFERINSVMKDCLDALTAQLQ